MRKAIWSLVLGMGLVLTVMILVGPTMAAEPDVSRSNADGPPAIGKLAEDGIARIGGPEHPSRAKYIKLRGTIDQLPTDTLTGTWTITDEIGELRTIEVTEQTKIVPPVIEPQVGDRVQVLARPDAETFVAKLIVVKAKGPGPGRPDPARPVEIHGQIEALPVTTDTVTGTESYLGEWVVSGFTVTVDSRTMIHPDKRSPEVGMRANIIAFRQEDGTLWAKNIALHAADMADYEFEGIIESLPEGDTLGVWVVDGISVTVVETTTLKGAPPAEGLLAEVKGIERDDGSILATEIKVEGPQHEKIKFEGKLLVFTDTRPSEWVIETKTDSGTEEISVTVTSETYLNTNKGPIKAGAWVKVKALKQDDGSFLALWIKVEDSEQDDSEVEFEGVIQSLPPEPYVGIWVVGEFSVTVTADTKVIGAPPAEGLVAEVEGKPLDDKTVEATKIKVEGGGHKPVTLEGTLVSTTTIPGEWVIHTDGGPISVTVDTTTALITSRGPIEIGAQVEVKALEQPDGSLLALYVRVEGSEDPPGQEEAKFEGTVEALPPSAPHSFNGPWTVETGGESVTVLVTGTTEIEGEPEVGSSVYVEGTWRENGSVRATLIKVQQVHRQEG